MACASCGGRRRQEVAAIAQSAPLYHMDGTDKWVAVTYTGTIGNHFVISPTRKVRTYGYYSRGDIFPAHIDDIRHSPHLFVPTDLDGVRRVWPNYPEGAPPHVVVAFGTQSAPADDKDKPPANVEEKAPAAKLAATKTVKKGRKKAASK